MKRSSILVLGLVARTLAGQVTAVIVAPQPFVDYSESQRQMQSLEASVTANPDGAMPIRILALAYARALYEGNPLKAHAEDALAASRNVWVLSNTAYSLQSLYNEGLQRGETKSDMAKLAEDYFNRAKAMDPNMDRAAILPVIDLQAIARRREAEQRERERLELLRTESVREIRRLPLSAFPQLPAAVRGVLAVRGCSVPQPRSTGAPVSVISGDFYGNGAVGWAVLCSDGTSTALLVFRNGNDSNPEALAVSEDRQWTWFDTADRPYYAHQIDVSSRATMEERAQRYGIEPARYNHGGIEDEIPEKGS